MSIVMFVLYYFTTFAVQRATYTKNTYTLNHIRLNQWYFTLCIKGYLMVLIVQYLKLVNMPTFRCLRLSMTFVFVCIRLAIAVYYVFWLIPSMFRLFMFALTLQEANWWKKQNDPFFTNCSPYNAFITWILWISFEITYWVFIIYGIILIIGCSILMV